MPNGSGEEVYFLVFAIFSNNSHLGFLTWPNFIILKPWSLIILHVEFDNNWCNGFREKVVWGCLNMSFLDIGIGANNTSKQKVGHCDKTMLQIFFIFTILNTYVPLVFHA